MVNTRQNSKVYMSTEGRCTWHCFKRALLWCHKMKFRIHSKLRFISPGIFLDWYGVRKDDTEKWDVINQEKLGASWNSDDNIFNQVSLVIPWNRINSYMLLWYTLSQIFCWKSLYPHTMGSVHLGCQALWTSPVHLIIVLKSCLWII